MLAYEAVSTSIENVDSGLLPTEKNGLSVKWSYVSVLCSTASSGAACGGGAIARAAGVRGAEAFGLIASDS